jgi:hypothetical protein
MNLVFVPEILDFLILKLYAKLLLLTEARRFPVRL